MTKFWKVERTLNGRTWTIHEGSEYTARALYQKRANPQYGVRTGSVVLIRPDGLPEASTHIVVPGGRP